MGFFSHRVERSDLEAGDHIYTWRTPVFAYSHHGIYVGGDIVVHFTQDQNQSEGNLGFSSSVPDVAEPCSAFQDHRFRKHTSGVVISCLNCFLGNGSLYRFQYGVGGATLVAKLQSGICTTAKSDPPKDVIHRAMYLLQNGFGKYNMFSHNCEDFALYCKTGLVVCSGKTSGLSGQASSIANASAATILSLPKIFVSNPLVLGATALGNYSLNRYFSDCGVRRDLKKVAVEDFAAFHADLPAEKDLHDDGAKQVITENSMIVYCGHRTGEINVVPCNKYVDCGCRTGRLGFQEQPQVCQWFQEPCKGRVEEILSDLRNRSLEGKRKSVGKDYAELVERWNDYKNACEREMKTLKQDCEREMKTLKQDCERETKTLKQDCEREMKTLKQDCEREMKTLKQELDGLKQDCEREMKTLKQELDGLKQDCEREMKMLKQDCEREMKTLKQELDGLKFKLHAVIVVGVLMALLAWAAMLCRI